VGVKEWQKTVCSCLIHSAKARCAEDDPAGRVPGPAECLTIDHGSNDTVMPDSAIARPQVIRQG